MPRRASSTRKAKRVVRIRGSSYIVALYPAKRLIGLRPVGGRPKGELVVSLELVYAHAIRAAQER